MLENRNLIKPKKAITLLKPMCFHSHQFKNYYIKEEKISFKTHLFEINPVTNLLQKTKFSK